MVQWAKYIGLFHHFVHDYIVEGNCKGKVCTKRRKKCGYFYEKIAFGRFKKHLESFLEKMEV